MTIREFIRRRVNRVWILFVVVLVTGCIGEAMLAALGLKIDTKLAIWVILSIAMAMAFWLLYRIKCPRCQLPLGLAGAMGTVDNCPHCEINFAESAQGSIDTAAPPHLPPVSIRKYLQRKSAKWQTTLLVCVVIGILGFATLYDLPLWTVMALAALATVAVILTAMIVLAFTPCPRCSTRLKLAGALALWKNPSNNCFTCGVNFDEGMT